MFARRSIEIKSFLNLKSHFILKRSTQHATKSNILNIRETYFPPHLKKEPKGNPFLKDLLFMKFDKQVLNFPVTQSMDRFKEFSKWLGVVDTYISSCAETTEKLNRKDILANLRDLEVFRSHLSEEHMGFNLSETEFLRLTETLSKLPWLGTYIVKNYMVPVQIISKYGSDTQKKEYFPSIISGDIIPTVCIKEGDNGTNINNIESTIVEQDGNNFLLNGEKSYVVNGMDCNLFVVFAHDCTRNTYDKAVFSAVLVERDFGGVTFTKVHEMIGRHEVPLCTVNFKNTVVPRRNVIGEPGKAFNIMMEQLKPGRQNISAQAISIMRNFLSRLTADVLETKHFDRNLYEFESVKKILGNIVYALYTMESMTYLTSGLADNFEDQDVEFERIITEMFCANKCLECVQAGLQLMGTQSYVNGNAYVQAFHDALALTTLDTCNIDTSTYIGSSAVQHLGKTAYDYVHKRRNPHNYPGFNMIQGLLSLVEPNLKICSNIHPSLHFSGICLEETVPKLKRSITNLLERHGTEVVKQQIELDRITRMLTELYGVTANLSRATKSYCTGIRNAEIEKNMVVTFAYNMRETLFNLAAEINDGDLVNGDYVNKSTVQTLYEQHKYPLEHPITRNI